MRSEADRRAFLSHTTGLGLGLMGVGMAARAAQDAPAAKPAEAPAAPAAAKPKKERPPALDDAAVKEFVGAAHGDLDKTRKLLDATPGLLNATWDWGGGDFETALGGASHMGRKDIAAFLLERGARMDLFAAAMLGKIEIVRAAAAAFPNIAKAPGPHNITLLAHAEKGGPEAAEVVSFLKTLV